MKSTLRNTLILSSLILSCTFCTKKPDNIDEVKTMKELTVPEGFKFETTKTVTVSIQLPSTVSYSATYRLVEIMDATPEGQPGQVIKTGAADKTGKYEQDITVTTATEKLFVKSFAGMRELSLETSGLKSTVAKFGVNYNVGYGRTAPDSIKGAPVMLNRILAASGKKAKSGSGNVIGNPSFSDDKLGQQEWWNSPMSVDGNWYSTNEVRKYASIVSEDGNSFLRIKSDTWTYGGIAQLIKSAPGQNVLFSSDIRGDNQDQYIYLYLIPRDEYGNYLDFFYCYNYNPGKDWTSMTVVGTMPAGTVACEILYWVNSNGTVDFDNAFVTAGDATDDRDGDGVLDYEDRYPYDRERAFNDFFPSEEQMGTCAFEDMWPSIGDFDFNDLVLDFRVNRISNAKNNVVDISFQTQVRAIGASLRNGFGIQMGFSPDYISSVKNDNQITADGLYFDENGTEKGQKLATIIFFDDAYKLLTHPGQGSPGINTSMGYPHVDPHITNLIITFREPMNPEEVDLSKFNAFIFRRDNRKHEIHFPGAAPTDLMDRGLFGTEDDASRPEEGYYYQTKYGLPWALSIPVQFDYIIEKKDIMNGYLRFKEWAYYGGGEGEDWYMDYEGYRNWEYIYRW